MQSIQPCPSSNSIIVTSPPSTSLDYDESSNRQHHQQQQDSNRSQSTNQYSSNKRQHSNIDHNDDMNQNHLSEYEKLRARNIERNNKRMVKLGLMTEEEALVANQKAWKLSSLLSSSMNVKDELPRETKSSKGAVGGMKKNKGHQLKTKKSNHDHSRKKVRSIGTRSKNTNISSEEGGYTDDIGHDNRRRKSARKPGKKPFETEGIWI